MKKINFSLMVCVLSAALIALNFPAQLQAQCTADAECNDGVFCNGTETCDIPTGNCVAVSACPPYIDGCVIRGAICDELNDRCLDSADNSLCDDGNIYNGVETCDISTGECQPGFTPFKTDLIAGGGGKAKSAIDVGDVLVWNDAENLYVKYIVTDPWCLTETHLQVETSLAMIPQKKGSPIPGQFEFMHPLTCVKDDLYTIPLSSFDGPDLYIAAHAVVARELLFGIFQYKTAWGAGFNFPSRNWATYFTYTLQCTSNSGCPSGSYCEKAEGDCSGEGVCEDIPPVCPDIWDPVCGCDGNTYPNACKAQAAGVSIDQTGSCACTTNADCPSETYCSKAEGDCSGTGSCVPPALACPDIWDPVCGCDGNTYQNSCYASWAGVSIDQTGSCGCTSNTDCPAGTYCNKAEGDCSGTGSCIPPALSCPDIWEPVCGCDGNTYQNSCFASWAEVSIANSGSCACSSNTDCPADSYCKKPEGDCSGSGSCQLNVPFACPVYEWDPVCGCDGTTYQSACYAAGAGVSIASTGSCWCSSNIECPDISYCKTMPGDCGGLGLCEVKPLTCPVIWDPVCGCDGTTYQNECDAAGSGVSINYNAECST